MVKDNFDNTTINITLNFEMTLKKILFLKNVIRREGVYLFFFSIYMSMMKNY